MKLTVFGLVLAVSLASPAATAQGKFCVVTQFAQHCHYYDLNYCRTVANQQGGMCVLNQEQAPQLTPILELGNHVQRGFEEGAAAGRKRRIAQLAGQAYGATPEVQRKLVQQAIYTDAEQGFALARALGLDRESSIQPPAPPEAMPLYQCPVEGGGTRYTSTPVEGCVYLGVAD